MRLSLDLGLGSIASLSAGVRYDPDAVALFARMDTQPTAARKRLDSDLIVGLKDIGWWDICDGFGILGAETAQASLLNWKGDIYNPTAVNAPTFTANRGYTGNGSNASLDTGFNPTTAVSPNFVLNSAHLMVFSLTDNSGNMYEIGNANARLGARHSNANQPRYTVNDTGTRNAGASASGAGNFVARRNGAATSRVFQDGVALGTEATTASTAVSNETIKLLGNIGATYSTKEVFGYSYGSAPTDQQISDLNSLMQDYWTAVSSVDL